MRSGVEVEAVGLDQRETVRSMGQRALVKVALSRVAVTLKLVIWLRRAFLQLCTDAALNQDTTVIRRWSVPQSLNAMALRAQYRGVLPIALTVVTSTRKTQIARNLLIHPLAVKTIRAPRAQWTSTIAREPRKIVTRVPVRSIAIPSINVPHLGTKEKTTIALPPVGLDVTAQTSARRPCQRGMIA